VKSKIEHKARKKAQIGGRERKISNEKRIPKKKRKMRPVQSEILFH